MLYNIDSIISECRECSRSEAARLRKAGAVSLEFGTTTVKVQDVELETNWPQHTVPIGLRIGKSTYTLLL